MPEGFNTLVRKYRTETDKKYQLQTQRNPAGTGKIRQKSSVPVAFLTICTFMHNAGKISFVKKQIGKIAKSGSGSKCQRIGKKFSKKYNAFLVKKIEV